MNVFLFENANISPPENGAHFPCNVSLQLFSRTVHALHILFSTLLYIFWVKWSITYDANDCHITTPPNINKRFMNLDYQSVIHRFLKKDVL